MASEPVAPSRKVTLVIIGTGVVGVIAAAALAWLAFQQARPVKTFEKQVVTKTIKREVRERQLVETDDRKMIMAWVTRTVVEDVPEYVDVPVTREIPPEQQLKLWIIGGAAGLGGLLTLGLCGAWVSYYFRGKNPPKNLDSLFKTVVTAIISATLGFLGNPGPHVEAKPKLDQPAITQPDKP